MKKRIFSVVLALCLCSSSPAMAYASQEVSSQPEDVVVEESIDPADSDDESTEPSEDSSVEKATETEENSEDVDTDLSEEPSESEDSSAEETTETEESSEDVDTDLLEEPSESEDSSTEVTTDETEESSEDVDTDLPEEPSESEDSSVEEATDELTSSEDETETLTEGILLEEDLLVEEDTYELVTYSETVPTPSEVYNAMIAFKEREGYTEGTTWTDYEPYSDGNYYHWHGGTLGGKNIVAVGCVAFAFELSDAAFGSLPNRMYSSGEFEQNEVKVGDILRMNTDTHTVIVLRVRDTGVVVAEGNYNGKVHWGRTISWEDVKRDLSHYITRYPAGYVSPDDPNANVEKDSGSLGNNLSWVLTEAGTLTISGSGAMPNYNISDQPWNAYNNDILRVVIDDGVTSIGDCAFYGCGLLSVSIPDSVITIGNNAFNSSSLISVTIPSSVRIIGQSAFRQCKNLRWVTFSEGLEIIEQNAFNACESLGYLDLPASIEEVDSGAFTGCLKMTDVTFAPGSNQVKLGDNLFTQCYGLISVTLPKNVDCIGAGMFQSCIMLPGVEIPQGAQSIGANAFNNSGVSVVIIPDSVISIGLAAFTQCPLTKVYYTGTEAQWNSINKMTDTGSALLTAEIYYNYDPTMNPDDGDDSDNPSNPDDGDDSSNPSNPDDGDDSSNPSNPDDGDDSNNPSNPDDGNDSNKPGEDDSNRPGGDDNNNPGEDDSNKPGGDDNNNSNGNDNNNPDEGGGNASSNGDGSNSSNSSSNSSANTTTTAKADTTPVPVKVVPVEGVQFEEGYTAAQADVSRDKKLGADLLQTYAGQNMYLNAVFGTDFGMTIDMAGVPTVAKDLEIRYTLAEEPMLAPEFDVVHAVPNEITPLGFDAVFNFYVGDEHTGKKVYIYVLNATKTGYDLVGTVFVNEIGNIAFHSTYVTDAMIFIEK